MLLKLRRVLMRTGTECCALRDADWTSCDFNNLPRAHAVVVSEIATAYSAGCGFRNPRGGAHDHHFS